MTNEILQIRRKTKVLPLDYYSYTHRKIHK